MAMRRFLHLPRTSLSWLTISTTTLVRRHLFHRVILSHFQIYKVPLKGVDTWDVLYNYISIMTGPLMILNAP